MRDEVEVSEDTYQGKPILCIQWADDDRYPFSFGVGKAKMLRAALKANPAVLDDFIAEHGSRK